MKTKRVALEQFIAMEKARHTFLILAGKHCRERTEESRAAMLPAYARFQAARETWKIGEGTTLKDKFFDLSFEQLEQMRLDLLRQEREQEHSQPV